METELIYIMDFNGFCAGLIVVILTLWRLCRKVSES